MERKCNFKDIYFLIDRNNAGLKKLISTDVLDKMVGSTRSGTSDRTITPQDALAEYINSKQLLAPQDAVRVIEEMDIEEDSDEETCKVCKTHARKLHTSCSNLT
jgi:hypothetical protein